MQKRLTWMLLMLMALVVFAGCSSDDDPVTPPTKTTFEVVAAAGTAYINGTGDYDYTIGSSLITAADLDNTFPKDGKASSIYTVIDIRLSGAYETSHIPGAYHSSNPELIEDIEAGTIPSDKPFVVACYSGQSAGHAVIALNLLGYPAKSLKFGMSSWHTSLSSSWNNATANSLDGDDTSADPTPELVNQPYPSPIGTDLKSSVMTMLDGNFKGIAYTGEGGLESHLDDENYFIINYFGEADYLGTGTRGTPGHIRGSCQFTPGSSLGLGELLNKLPSDENALVVVYCWTGQTSSQITAYLNMLGYNAKSLKNGANKLFYDDLNTGGWKWDGATVIDRPLELPTLVLN